MKVLDLTLPSPEENLACDEALLEACENGTGSETIRFWEPDRYFAVLGYSNKAETETKKEACVRDHVPILRRISGGGTILQGPGCLNYSLILEIKKFPELATVTGANRFIMNRNKEALASLLSAKHRGGPALGGNKEVTVEGHTDLTLKGFKFSGNSQRRKREFVLFHGTFLLNFDFDMVEKYLRMPSQEPGYRKKRPHKNFLINLKTKPERIKSALKKIWGAKNPLQEVPHAKIRRLALDVYSKSEWNFKF